VPWWRGIRVVGAKALDVGRFAEDLRCRERSATADREQRWREPLDERGDPGFELFDLVVEAAAAIDEVACQSRDDARRPVEPGGGLVEAAGPIERAGSGFPGGSSSCSCQRRRLMMRASFGDEVLAVIDQKPHFALGGLEPRGRQARLT